MNLDTIRKPPQFYRQRFILGLLYVFGKKLNKTDLQKYLFLYQQEYNQDNQTYYFLPYKYGPFSFQSYADLRRLEQLNYIKNGDFIELIDNFDYSIYFNKNDIKLIIKFYNNYKNLKGRDLIKYVYRKYPYFASKSIIKDEITENENNINFKKADNAFFTIGYEGLTIDEFLNTIILNDIKLVADVRKNPISMKYGFSKKTLDNALTELNIDYIHIPELGIDSKQRQNLYSKNDYQKLFDNYEKEILDFQENAIKKLFDYYTNKNRITIVCFEKDYQFCHRSRIAKRINDKYNIEIFNL